MDLLKKVMLEAQCKDNINIEPIMKHMDWAKEKLSKYSFTTENIDEIFNYEIGEVFKEVLLDCGVFKFGNKLEEMDLFIDCLKK